MEHLVFDNFVYNLDGWRVRTRQAETVECIVGLVARNPLLHVAIGRRRNDKSLSYSDHSLLGTFIGYRLAGGGPMAGFAGQEIRINFNPLGVCYDARYAANES